MNYTPKHSRSRNRKASIYRKNGLLVSGVTLAAFLAMAPTSEIIHADEVNSSPASSVSNAQADEGKTPTSSTVEKESATVDETSSQADRATIEPANNENRQENPVTESNEINTTASTSTDDGTVELADSYTATKTIEKAVVDAAIQSDDYLKKQYEVFPTPQKTTYGDGVVRLDQGVNIVVGDDVDIYTRNRLKEVLQVHDVSYQTSDTASTELPNIYLGILNEKNNPAREALAEISQDLFEKIDAYALVIKNNKISVLGKDTDSVFYGLTTLKHMLNESPLPILRETVVEDYANIKNRGFIEGYYGNPWSNEDRAELMRYGGDLKLNQYFFAPKDDPYHNSKWRELYPDEKLPELRELARAGNQSKTRYVWTIHPFMHKAFRFDTDAHYQEDLAVVQAKFTQLMRVGVREFGVLADDAPAPTGGYASYNRLMQDLTTWLTAKQAEFDGLCKEMIFVPGRYAGKGTEEELRSLNSNLPETVTMTLTGGKIWGEVSNSFLQTLKTNLTADGSSYRPISLWINWPCTDNSKQHLILGGGEKFLHANVDSSLIHGLMLNPMQQSEPSKVALFSSAEYTWNIWKSDEKAQEVNRKAFDFIEAGKFESSAASAAFRELGKHMINQNMDSRVVKLEESVELAPKLEAFLIKLKAGEDASAEREILRSEFARIKDAAQTYKEQGNERMKAQIHYWLDNTIDQMNALDYLLTATENAYQHDDNAIWANYNQGLKLYNQSKNYKFWYVDHYENAELGVQHIRPFILDTLNYLAKTIENSLDPTALVTTYISNRSDVTGSVARVTDGDLGTDIYYKEGSAIQTGDYVGLQFNHEIAVHSISFAMGRAGNLLDRFTSAKVQYRDAQGEWQDVNMQDVTGSEELVYLSHLDVKATAVRLIATSDKENSWLGVREIKVNSPILVDTDKIVPTITRTKNINFRYQTSAKQLQDGSNDTLAYLANANNTDNVPVGAFLKLSLDKERPIRHVKFVQGAGMLYRAVLEYSSDNKTWTQLSRLDYVKSFDKDVDITAKYLRVRNEQEYPSWWYVAEFDVDTSQGELGYADSNVDAFQAAKTMITPGDYDLKVPENAILRAGEYFGIKLDRIRQLRAVEAQDLNPNLMVKYSPNLVEWYDLSQSSHQDLARYIRIVNLSDSDQVIGSSHLRVQTVEIADPSIVSTTLGIHSAYGAGDVRRVKNLGKLFDGKFDKVVSFSDYPTENGSVVLDLGVNRDIRKIRAYVKDETANYLRDGKIQVSANGQDWTDVVTVGDGVVNEQHDDSLTDGWTHDAQMPGNRYIEGSLATPTPAKYLRILFTAAYPHRFLDFTEIVINEGEYVKEVNNSVVVSQSPETRHHTPMELVDHDILTSYKPNAEAGEFIYHLSENTKANHVRLLSNIAEGSTVKVYARITDKDYPEQSYANQVVNKWVELGSITSNFDTFLIKEDDGQLLDIRVVWQGGKPEFYEISTYYQPIDKLAPVISEVSDVEIRVGDALPAFNVTATDQEDGEVAVVTDSSAVRLDTVGNYPVTFTAVDSKGNKATKQITVTVKALPDVTAPVISEVSDVEIRVGDALPAFNVTATDQEDGEVAVVTDSSAVRLDTVGNYPVTFTAVDSKGNKATKQITVTVKALPDVTAPVISEVSDVEIRVGDALPAFNVTATDQEDGEVAVVTDSSAVRLDTVGNYPVTFTAVDSKGNKATKQITVTILEAPLQVHVGSTLVGEEKGLLFESLPEYDIASIRDIYQDASGVVVQVSDLDSIHSLNLLVQDGDENHLNAKSEMLAGLDYDVYNIHFEKDGVTYAIQGQATVGIQVDASKEVADVLYLLETEDGVAQESLPFVVQDGVAYFKVTHFSSYALVYKPITHIGSMLAGEVNGPTVAILPEFDLSSLEPKEEPLQVHVGSMLAGESNGPTVAILPEFDTSSLEPKEEPLQVHVGSMLAGELNGPTVAILPEFDLSSLEPKEEPLQVHVGSMLAGEVNGPTVAILPEFDFVSLAVTKEPVKILTSNVKEEQSISAPSKSNQELPNAGERTSILGVLGLSLFTSLGFLSSYKKKNKTIK